MNTFEKIISYRGRQVVNRLYNMPKPFIYTGYVDLFDKEANVFIYNFLCANENRPVMIAKFGNVELDNIVAYRINKSHLTFESFKDLLLGNIHYNYEYDFQYLYNNAGFYPYDISLIKEYYDRMCNDIPQIDI